MNDLLLIAAVPVTIVLVATIYYIADYWWMHRSDCYHSWTRWSDPRTDAGHPYQTRYCTRCNEHKTRLV